MDVYNQIVKMKNDLIKEIDENEKRILYHQERIEGNKMRIETCKKGLDEILQYLRVLEKEFDINVQSGDCE